MTCVYVSYLLLRVRVVLGYVAFRAVSHDLYTELGELIPTMALVRKSAFMSSVPHQRITTYALSTCSYTKKYWRAIYLLRPEKLTMGEEFILIVALLSSWITLKVFIYNPKDYFRRTKVLNKALFWKKEVNKPDSKHITGATILIKHRHQFEGLLIHYLPEN